ncbi:MAG: response regulator transcription factor [Taibaiella sp.]|jgi:DNA-binding LytR/AlgR family response regulator
MINCIAVDDEPLALGLLADNISKVPYLKLEASCNDAFEATKVLKEKNIDLVFIDIQMPGLTGLQFISSLQHKPMVILTTAYKQYALDGYQLNVVDYLLKPVDMARFMAACNKAQELYELRNTVNRKSESTTQDYFFINVDYSLMKVVFKDIIWIEGLRDYVKIYLKSTPGKPLVTRVSIKSLEEQLPASLFIRIHKSYIISVDSITSVRKNSVFIKDQELTVGETYKEVIRNLTGF